MAPQPWLYLGLIFVAVSAAVWGVAYWTVRERPVQGRLRRWAAWQGVSQAQPSETVAWTRLLQGLAALAQPRAQDDISRLQARFYHAGLRGRAAPVLFFSTKTVAVLVLPWLVWWVVRMLGGRPPLMASLLILLSTAAVGYALPNAVLAWATRRRQRALFEAFPDAIDLMVVCVEAGLGLDMALNRAAHEIRLRSPELADELDRVVLELRVGAARDRALRNLATRTGLDEMASFATMLIQADRFGTSLADSLRVHADSLRTRRRLRAEEAAAKIPLKLLFPLIFFIFPSMMLVLLGPAMIQIYRTLLPTLSGAP